MKEKIMAALRSKYANYGLSDKALLGIATMLAITVTDEANIETAIEAEGVVEALKGVQGEVDSRVKTAVAKAKGGNSNPQNPEPQNPDPKDEVPAWFKGVQDEIKSLKEQLAGQKTKDAASELIAAAKAKGIIISERYAKSYVSEEDYDQANALAELEAEWTGEKQFAANSQAGNGQVPNGQQQQHQQQQGKVAPEISNFTKSMKAQAEGAKAKSV
ncbi:hypothetical protein [Desertivirga xinjiangensis]|uniref:hypothetical protein n=1 Tax=Desertivirga xinjiangensis TaxID=539206 RepID=UPI00210AEDCB|nr:hypothetical protein [Pedobacter xinjiangensis]